VEQDEKSENIFDVSKDEPRFLEFDVSKDEPRFLEFDVEMFTLICRFIVMQNKVIKYMTRMGQKTGMLKNSKKVQKNAMTVAFVAEYQNLNSEKISSDLE